MKLPLRGLPRDVVEDLAEYISEVVDAEKVDQFYIGRTTDIPSTINRHDPEDMIKLYETESTDNAIEVEDTLIKAFYNHPKCDNDNPHGGGGVSIEFVSNVYLALWYV